MLHSATLLYRRDAGAACIPTFCPAIWSSEISPLNVKYTISEWDLPSSTTTSLNSVGAEEEEVEECKSPVCVHLLRIIRLQEILVSPLSVQTCCASDISLGYLMSTKSSLCDNFYLIGSKYSGLESSDGKKV